MIYVTRAPQSYTLIFKAYMFYSNELLLHFSNFSNEVYVSNKEKGEIVSRDNFLISIKNGDLFNINRDDYFSKYASERLDKEKKIPVANPYIDEDEMKGLMAAYFSGWISSQGECIKDFENDFSSKFSAKYSVTCSNGTAAIQLALMALGIGPGDEVLCPDFTFAATANAILSVGARPVFIDSSIENWCIDTEKISNKLSSRTRVIIVVHVFGQVANLGEVKKIANQHGLYLIEDNAESLGSKYYGKYTGTIGDIGTYSFFANKIITTGEGGMCTTNSEVLAERMREIRDHGMSPKKRYWHEIMGLNLRMTNLQAAIGIAQLGKIEILIKKRRELEKKYIKYIDPKKIKIANNNNQNIETVVWFVSMLIDADNRSKVISEATKVGIDIRPFFKSLSTMPAFSSFGSKCINSEYIAERGINLPTHTSVDDATVKKISHIINRFCKNINE